MTFQNFQTIPVSPAHLAQLSRDLVAVGERLEASGNPDWFPVARAAAFVDGVRHNMVSFPAANEGDFHGAH